MQPRGVFRKRRYLGCPRSSGELRFRYRPTSPKGRAENQPLSFGATFQSHGSLNEIETCLVIAERLGYLTHEKAQVLLGDCAEVGRMTQGLYKSIMPRQGNQ